MDERALVIVNPRARRGAAIHAYREIRAEVEAGDQVREALLDARGEWQRALGRARREGFRRVVAVGGDGTVNAVANALLFGGLGKAKGMSLGAVGLGSSNDFHKPVRNRVRGVPIRVGAPVARDAGLATWVDARGVPHARWFVVSASIGLCARANRRFSCGRGAAAWLGARSVDAAIAYAAIGALARHGNVRGRLDRERGIAISNLSVMLTPYLAGSFRYDAAVQRGDGRFAVHLCEGMTTLGLLGAMAELLRGRSSGTPGMTSWSSQAVSVDLDHEDDLELDGELFRATSVRFEAFPKALEVCA